MPTQLYIHDVKKIDVGHITPLDATKSFIRRITITHGSGETTTIYAFGDTIDLVKVQETGVNDIGD